LAGVISLLMSRPQDVHCLHCTGVPRSKNAIIADAGMVDHRAVGHSVRGRNRSQMVRKRDVCLCTAPRRSARACLAATRRSLAGHGTLVERREPCMQRLKAGRERA